MNIKLVTNIEDGIYSPINRQVMLQTVDDSYQLENYSGKKLYILNTATNERFEILPTLKKYSIAEINYAAYEHDYLLLLNILMPQIFVLYFICIILMMRVPK